MLTTLPAAERQQSEQGENQAGGSRREGYAAPVASRVQNSAQPGFDSCRFGHAQRGPVVVGAKLRPVFVLLLLHGITGPFVY